MRKVACFVCGKHESGLAFCDKRFASRVHTRTTRMSVSAPAAPPPADYSGLAAWWNGGTDACLGTGDPKTNWRCGASKVFAHVAYTRHLHSEVSVVEKWNTSWLLAVERRLHGWENRTLVDYGIGAGLLGVELLTRRGLSRYVRMRPHCPHARQTLIVTRRGSLFRWASISPRGRSTHPRGSCAGGVLILHSTRCCSHHRNFECFVPTCSCRRL